MTTADNDPRPWQPSDGDTRCQDCGHTYVPWLADNAMWNLVVGGSTATDDPGGCLCPRCFTKRAAVLFPFVWRLTPEWTPSLTRVISPVVTEP